MKAREIERLLAQQPTATPPAELADRIKAEIPEHLEVAPELLDEPVKTLPRRRVWRMLKVAAVVMPLLLTVLVSRHLVDRYDDFEQALVTTQADQPNPEPAPAAAVSPSDSAAAEEKASPQPEPAEVITSETTVAEEHALPLPEPTEPLDTDSLGQSSSTAGIPLAHAKRAEELGLGRIEARVCWQGEPLPGVTVFVEGEAKQGRATAVTNVNGEAQIRFLPAGEYTLRAELDTFESQTAQLRINKRQVANVDIQMVARPVKERITVTSGYKTISSPSPLLASSDISELEELPVGRDTVGDEIAVSDSRFAGSALGRTMPAAFDGVKKQQPATWKRSHLVANSSRLMIGDREELPLRGLQAEVAIDGFRARVVLDLYFYNDHNRRVEGTFKLRLPDNASPYYFAFGEEQMVGGLPRDQPSFQTDRNQPGRLSPGDLSRQRKQRWRNVKEARMVPKEQAAHAYTETVRRRVDPALVEWSGAGIYSARVYPLAPRRLHRIVIGYDVDLLEVDGNLEYRLDLPATAAKRSVDISVAELDRPIQITPEVEGTTSNGRRLYRWQQDDLRTVTVRIPAPGNIMLTDEYDQAGPLLAARLRPELPAASDTGAATDAIFLVDTSLSSSPDRFAIWMRLLPAILEQNRDTIERFAVLFFSVDRHWWQPQLVRNRSGNVEQLLGDAEDLVLEGASDLAAALSEAGSPGPEGLAAGSRPRTIFLLSDGHATWGERDLAGVAARLDAPVFAYRTGLAGTDTSALAAVARVSGGAVFSVIGDSEISSAATAHRSRSWQIDGIELAGCSDLVLAGRPSDLYPGQTVMLAGRGTPERGSQVVLHLSRGRKELTLRLTAAHLLRSELATRTYGTIATGQLESYAHLTEQYSRAYARHFRVPGRTCSLLMLDSEADYQRFNIKPAEDAYIVKTTTVNQLVPASATASELQLPDQRQLFSAWLQRLPQMPGVNLQVPAYLNVAVQQIPEQSFTIRPQPLRCQVRRLDQIPPQLTEILLPDQVDYDLLSAEAERRLVEHSAADALKALSSLVEANPGDPVTVRDVALSAVGWGLGGHAHSLLQRVIETRPAEPHSYHQMARVLTELGNTELALVYYELCLAARWDSRFGDLHRIIGLDYLRFLRRIEAGELQTSLAELAGSRLDRLEQQHSPSSADLLVVLTWNTDRTDVDLRVTEPSGEECSYQNATTRIGGTLSRDVTDGYGPEMYLLPRAVAGSYRVRANYFTSDRNRASARSKVYATIYQSWGRPDERVSHKVVTLTQGQETVDIATIKIGK
jgi:hypothetical protein